MAGIECPLILVVGAGSQRSELRQLLNPEQNVRIVATDIDISADVDYFCDAHDLPFADKIFDGVITTAVLEHVLDPRKVAKEIGRVTKNAGLLYSELPFMQQVHEGAYDFTRHTLSGHRWLFREYGVIESGIVAGPGTALVWAIERFVSALFGARWLSKIVRGATRLMFFWLKYFDYLTKDSGAAMDAASCTFLLARKASARISEQDVIEGYIGSQNMQHV
jgi:SAM-dependent methyltransferase